jgi:hypothetical protein
MNAPRFLEVFCSQCGQSFGPGDHGFSHCSSHRRHDIVEAIPCTVSDEYHDSVFAGVIEILADHRMAEPDCGLPAGLEFHMTRLHVGADARAFTTDCLLVRVDGQREIAITHNPDAPLGRHLDIDDDGLRAELSAYFENA